MHVYIDDSSSPMKEFELPFGFYPELSRTNPFLTDEGSQSIPLSLPATEHNLSLLGFPNRLLQTARPNARPNSILADGTAWIRGILYIEKVSKTDGIECTFYTNEGQLYEVIGEKLLGELKWTVSGVIGIGKDAIDNRMQFMFKAMTGAINQDYYVFPVQTSREIKRPGDNRTKLKLILNETLGSAADGSDVRFIAGVTREYIDTSEGTDRVVKTPLGYGMTPFLKVSYLLDVIFRAFNYIPDSNIFKTDPDLSRLCVLNNTADAICDDGTLYYKQLIPYKKSVMDFLNALRAKFGVEFTERNRHISVRSWEEVLSLDTDFDFTPYLDGEVEITPEESTALTISMQREIEGSEVKGDTYEEVYKKYSGTGVTTDQVTVSTLQTDWVRQEYYTTTIDHQYTTMHTELAGSSFFDRLYAGNKKKEEIQFTDSSVPVRLARNSVSQGDTNRDIFSFPLPTIGDVKHMNSYLSVDNKKVEEKENEDMDIMFCFACPGLTMYGRAVAYPEVNQLYMPYYLGSSFQYTMRLVDGQFSKVRWGNTNLRATQENSLYDRFYQKRDTMLRQANQAVSFKAVLPAHLIASMDIVTPKTVNGIKIIVERIDYVLGREDLCRVTARSLHQFAGE